MSYVRLTKTGQFGRWLAACLLLGATPLLAVLAWSMYRTAAATSAWPTTPGVITRADLRDVGRHDGYQRYEPDVAYTYRVGDREYTGTRLRIADPRERLKPAEAAIAGLAAGQTHPVYYDPADPAQSLLKPGAVSGEAWMFILPVVSFIGGMAVLAWLVKTRGQARVHLEPYV